MAEISEYDKIKAIINAFNAIVTPDFIAPSHVGAIMRNLLDFASNGMGVNSRDINANTTAIENLQDSLDTAVADLGKALQSEKAERSSSDNTLKELITQETRNRTSAITVLEAALRALIALHAVLPFSRVHTGAITLAQSGAAAPFEIIYSDTYKAFIASKSASTGGLSGTGSTFHSVWGDVNGVSCEAYGGSVTMGRRPVAERLYINTGDLSLWWWDASVEKLIQVTSSITEMEEFKESVNAREELFSIDNTYIALDGKAPPGNGHDYRATDFIPINRNFPIEGNIYHTANMPDVAFYNHRKEFISAVPHNDTNAAILCSFSIAVADIPADAAYFRTSTYFYNRTEKSWWRNGPTREAREGAVSEALSHVAAKVESVDSVANSSAEKLTALESQFQYSGKFIGTTGLEYADGSYLATDYIPINRSCAIEVQQFRTANMAKVAFFDSAKVFISAITGESPGLTTAQVTRVEPAEIPANAAYFRTSTNRYRSPSYWTHCDTHEKIAGAVATAAAGAVDAALDKWWLACVGTFGKVDHSQVNPYMLNDVWLTPTEAMSILVNSVKMVGGENFAAKFTAWSGKTMLPPVLYNSAGNISLERTWAYASSLEILQITSSEGYYRNISSLRKSFQGCSKLREIRGVISMTGSPDMTDAFTGCKVLESVQLKTHVSVSFADCPLLTAACVRYMVENRLGTGAITFTVHPDVYANLAGDSGKLSDWSGLLDLAAEKNITFATTN